MNEQVERWQLRGEVFLWKYRGWKSRNYSGWNFTADAPGCASVLQLLDACLSSPYAASASIKLTTPSDDVLAIPNAKAPITAARVLKLAYAPKKWEASHWCLTSELVDVCLEVGVGSLEQFRDGVLDVAAGKGDYCIGDDQSELWFWWHPTTWRVKRQHVDGAR